MKIKFLHQELARGISFAALLLKNPKAINISWKLNKIHLVSFTCSATLSVLSTDLLKFPFKVPLIAINRDFFLVSLQQWFLFVVFFSNNLLRKVLETTGNFVQNLIIWKVCLVHIFLHSGQPGGYIIEFYRCLAGN